MEAQPALKLWFSTVKLVAPLEDVTLTLMVVPLLLVEAAVGAAVGCVPALLPML